MARLRERRVGKEARGGVLVVSGRRFGLFIWLMRFEPQTERVPFELENSFSRAMTY